MSLTNCNTQESGPCTSPGQQGRAGPEALPRNCAKKQEGWPRQGCQEEIASSMGRTRRLKAITPTVLTVSVAMVEL